MSNCMIIRRPEADKLKPKAYYYYGDPTNLGVESRTSSSFNGSKLGWVTSEPSPTVTPTLITWSFNQGSGNIGAVYDKPDCLRGYLCGTFVPTGGWNNASIVEGSGTRTWDISALGLDNEHEYTFMFETGQDEGGSGTFGTVKVKFNDTWYTLDQAVTEKLIKPLILIGILGGGTAATIYSGGNTSGATAGVDNRFVAIMTNKKRLIQAIQWYRGEPEHEYRYWCDSNNGRFTYGTNVYTTSQYGEKYW